MDLQQISAAIPLFTSIIQANETLYKGMNVERFDPQYDHPIWFSQRKETAEQYGSYLHHVITTRPIKLINITSPYFQNTFMDFLNHYFKHEPTSFERKMNLLVPIGLPNEQAQQTFLSSRGVRVRQLSSSALRDVAFFYNHHRFSQMDLDSRLVQFLNRLFSQFDFDGYIAPCVWPSKYHVQFSDEVCLFKLRDTACLSHVRVQHSPSFQSGGSSYDIPKASAKQIEKNTMFAMETLRTSKWKGKFVLGLEGYLMEPDDITLIEHANKLRRRNNKS
jgi:hypothetical protein